MKKSTSLVKPIINLLCLPLKMSKDLRKYVFSVALKHETEDYCEHEFFGGYYHIEKAINLIKKMKIKDHIIVDVGGATGATAKLFTKYFSDNKIWVFEPIKSNYDILISLAKQNSNLKIIPKAAGSKNEKTFINKANRITSSSLYELNADKKSKILSEILVPEGKEEIEMTTLDDILPNKTISILKFDVQGYELEALKGSLSTLENTVLIVIEMNNHDGYKGAPKYHEVDSFLRNNNFILFDMFPSFKDNDQLKEWDCIYMNRNYLK